MMKLVTLGGAFGLRNVSPFCLKTEMTMTYFGFEFELIEADDPRTAPKGKMPYLILEDGQTLSDSELILSHLDAVSQGKIYGGLSDAERGIGFAFTRLAEDHLYWLMVASRWLDDEWFHNVVRDFFHFVPGLVRSVVANSERRRMAKTLMLHGLGKHAFEEQQGFARRDLKAISDASSVTPYLTGHRITVFDFTLAGMLSGILDNQPETWLTKIAMEYPLLRDYVDRIELESGVTGRLC